MIDNATATRHALAEPKPGPRESAFAQGVLAMTEKTRAAAARTVEATEIVFRSRMTWALVTGALLVGAWGNSKLNEVARVGESQSEILSVVREIQKDLIAVTRTTEEGQRKQLELGQQILSVQEELKRQERERRLLQDEIETLRGGRP